MIRKIKQKGLYQKRSTPASLPPVKVKWTIEDKREAWSVFFYRLHTGTVLGTLTYISNIEIHFTHGTLFLTVSPRTIFHSFSGTIGWRLFPRCWRGNRRGKILFNPNGFHGIEGIFFSFFHNVIQYGAERDVVWNRGLELDVTNTSRRVWQLAWQEWLLSLSFPLLSPPQLPHIKTA